jgi:hypothetical protein
LSVSFCSFSMKWRYKSNIFLNKKIKSRKKCGWFHKIIEVLCKIDLRYVTEILSNFPFNFYSRFDRQPIGIGWPFEKTISGTTKHSSFYDLSQILKRNIYESYMELTGSWLGVDWELTGSCTEIAIKEKNCKLDESFHSLFNWIKSFFATLGENFRLFG